MFCFYTEPIDRVRPSAFESLNQVGLTPKSRLILKDAAIYGRPQSNGAPRAYGGKVAATYGKPQSNGAPRSSGESRRVFTGSSHKSQERASFVVTKKGT